MKRHLASSLIIYGFAAVLVVATGFERDGFAAEPIRSRDTLTTPQAYQRLLATRFFAFGGVGFAGTMSEGERAFHVVAASTNALNLFLSVLKHGNPEAQLYALCGLRRLASDKFDTFAKPIVAAEQKVRTMTGCLARDERASEVVARIAGGGYDVFWHPLST